MKETADSQPLAAGADWLAGGGEMGSRIRAFDWSTTALGPVQTWPQSLRSALSICLPSKAQIILCWGPELITLYNDGYRPVFGAKHPRVLGLPVREAWRELWPQGLKELFEGVVATGVAFWADDLPFTMERNGYAEEAYFDVSYDPVGDESGRVGGIFAIVNETTARVVGERRLRTLRDLGTRTADGKSAEDVFRLAFEVFQENPHDVPFAYAYVEGRAVDAGAPPASAWLLIEAAQSGQPVVVQRLGAGLDALPGGPWPEPAQSAVVLPIVRTGGGGAHGLLVAGVSPRQRVDADYLTFFTLAAGQLATAVANALAYEEERKRAEALAAIDRAKTAFFTNVSHEFRTPLTLMLGPLAELERAVAPGPQQELVGTAQRNAQRLLKLVNTLLDFARVEGGRADSRFEPTDLAASTIELASSFRSICQHAGLKLIVDCPPLPEPVFVDRDQWEKIVLNLLSNAFKFTLEGEIEVRLRAIAHGNCVELSVRDTGCGIPASELPTLFKRFKRIEGQRGRSFEGSGIGLALVQELVKLHGGTIEAGHANGGGMTFTVSVPFGSAHLPADRLRPGGAAERGPSQTQAYVGEALQWLPADAALLQEAESGFVALDPPSAAALGYAPYPAMQRVLVVDDNADLRNYVARLLGAHYSVRTANDGLEALASAQHEPPDLILADVMMPGLDGFGLVARLRADQRTRTLPVILLSARAGEESRIEGLEAGADDYLVKPFSARELLARVSAHLAAARIRREADAAVRESEEHLRMALVASRAGVWTWHIESGKNDWSAELFQMFAVDPRDPDKVQAAQRRMRSEDVEPLRRSVAEQLEIGDTIDVEFRIDHPTDGMRWFNARGRRDQDRVRGITLDVTGRKAARGARRSAAAGTREPAAAGVPARAERCAAAAG